MYINRVRSNLKGGVDAVLGPKTIVIGPSGTGKGAVLNSIEIALTGRADDITGRFEVTKELDLMALAPERKGDLFTEVQFDNGSLARYETGGSSARARKASHIFTGIDPENVLPLRRIRAALLGSPETGRKFFLGYAVGVVSLNDVMGRIPDTLHSYFKSATIKATLKDTPTDRLLMALEEAKARVRRGASEAKASRKVAEQSSEGLPTPPTNQQVAEAQAAVVAAKAAVEGAIQQEVQQQTAARASGSLDSMRAQVEKLKLELVTTQLAETQAREMVLALNEQLSYLPEVVPLSKVQEAIVHLLAHHVEAGLPECLLCGGTTANLPERNEFAKGALANRAAGIQRQLGMTAQLEAARSSLRTLCTQIEWVTQSLTSASAMLQAAELAAPTLGWSAVMGLPEAREALVKAENTLAAFTSAQTLWTNSKKALENAMESDKASGEWDQLIEACRLAVRTLLDSGVATFQARVQAALPATDVFELRLRDGDREVFQFGLVKNKVLHTALSGGEWARVTIAMAAACSSDQFEVIIPEDRGMDGATLAGVLVAFTNLSAQVVIGTTTEPLYIPTGWTVIRTSANEHRNQPR
ncbi:MAG: hypothetical protein Q7R39_11110 [Dehalococcoidia bacterium]|nr:hypothetical protein [Dehalococcoidia bacterium]